MSVDPNSGRKCASNRNIATVYRPRLYRHYGPLRDRAVVLDRSAIRRYPCSRFRPHADRLYRRAGRCPSRSFFRPNRRRSIKHHGKSAEVEHAVRDLGFVGAHLYPHWFDEAPDAAKYYPFYAKCCELGVPIQMQVGHCLVYNPHRRLPTSGDPSVSDRIAMDFPDLKLVGIHIGTLGTKR